EDGIRDYKVTGVQTCALPIYRADPDPVAVGKRRRRPDLLLAQKRAVLATQVLERRAVLLDEDARMPPRNAVVVQEHGRAGVAPRSEERRVGKEWGSRWSAEER